MAACWAVKGTVVVVGAIVVTDGVAELRLQATAARTSATRTGLVVFDCIRGEGYDGQGS